jgi:hypothetical protein
MRDDFVNRRNIPSGGSRTNGKVMRGLAEFERCPPDPVLTNIVAIVRLAKASRLAQQSSKSGDMARRFRKPRADVCGNGAQ